MSVSREASCSIVQVSIPSVVPPTLPTQLVNCRRSEINDLQVLKSHPQNEKDFIRSLLE